MSQGATPEEKLGGLHQLINAQYTHLCSDPTVTIQGKDGNDKEVQLLTPKELLVALSGGAKFLNDNGIKAPRFVSDTSELEGTLKKKPKRAFGKVIEMKEALG